MDHSLLAQQPPPNETGIAGSWHAAIRRGDFETAWRANDAVLATRDPATRDDPARPYHERWVWDGTPVAGRCVLVRCYHGLGDTLMFSRFLPLLARVAGSVTVEVQPGLMPLLRDMPVRLVAFDPAAPLPPSEVDVEIMELSHALRARPDPAPYLAADRLAHGGTGLCWAASGWDPDRNLPAAALRPLLRRRRGVSLQRGAAALAAGEIGVHDPLGGSMDLGLLAQLVAGLDQVVTIDTMVAHLAGALGIPTFVLLKSDPDWRWGGSAHTPWYGSVTTVWQPTPGDWDGAVALLRGTLGDA